MLIHQYLEYYARNFPDLPCLTTLGETVSYSNVDVATNQMANGLQGLGMSKGDRLAVLGENNLHHLISFMAASKIGAVVVSLNYRLAPAELEFIIKDANTKVLVTVGEMEDVVSNLLPMLSDAIQVISTGSEEGLNWDRFLAANEESRAVEYVAPQDAFFQLYTSGTTGNPKGVVLSHFNLFSLHNLGLTSFLTRPNPGDTSILCAPMFHIGGAGSMVNNIYDGLHTLLHQTFNPETVVSDIENNTETTLFMVPAMIMAILQMPDIENRDFSKLKQIFYGASPISESVLQRAMEIFQCEFLQLYGMTETTGTVVNLSSEDHKRALEGKPELLRSCGRPSVGVEIKIMDLQGNEVAVGEVGEIWIKSDTNMLEYYNLAEATAETLTDGWVHSGDAGYLDEEGYLFLKDRMKDMVVSGGENVYPVEVENALAKHEAIVDVAVIGVPNEKFGEALLAFVVLKSDTNFTVEEMIEFCRDKIAGYKIPRQLEVIDEMPRNPSGKILKKILREPYWIDTDRNVG